MNFERFGKYELIHKIAVGGMAEVFKAKITGEKGFEKLLVIKKVLPHLAAEDKWIEHFIDEAKLAALLNHENIIHVYDFGSVDDNWFIAMEYLAGMDLKQVITKGDKEHLALSVENILYIMSKVCEGLDYAHNLTDLKGGPLNIIHRDISPQNIFITFDGNVKIIDFGIAKTAARSTQTQAGIIKGKLSYMAPEQAEGKKLDHRVDIYSAGIIFYELLTGKRMFAGDVSDMLLKVISADYEPPENILENYPSKLCEIVNKALSKNLDDRYQTAGEMQADIEDCIFDLEMRTGARILSNYMKRVFTKEYTEEKYDSVPTLDMIPEDEPGDDRDYVKTSVMDSQGNVDLDAGDGKPDDGDKKPAFGISILQKTTSLAGVIFEKASGKIVGFDYSKPLLILKSKKIPILVATFVLLVISFVWNGHRNDVSQIKTLLASAEQSYSEGRLTRPEESSAYYYYSEVLQIDSDNQEAREGLSKIATRCIEEAERKLSLFRHETAMSYIEIGLRIDPENDRLLELKKEAEKRVPDRLFKGIKSIFGSDEDSEEHTTE